MKKIMIVLFAMCFTAVAIGQKPTRVVESDLHQLVVEFNAGKMVSTAVECCGNPFSLISMEGYGSTSIVGLPQLPITTEFIEIPICEGVEYKVVEARYDTLDLNLKNQIIPSQPSQCKSDNSHHELQIDKEVYAMEDYFSHPMIQVKEMGIARDKNLAKISFAPIQYNPQSGKIVVCTNVVVQFNYINVDEKSTYDLKRYSTPAFSIGHEVLNSLNTALKIDNSTIPIRLLVVSDPMFKDALVDYVAWKRRKGFIVDVVYKGQPEVGNTSVSIINYIKGQYTNATEEKPAPTYIVLVGDVEQVPACADNYPADAFWYEEHHPTDLYYAEWTDDMIPDAYYGRFSAQTVDQLIPQLEKTMMYEKYAFNNPDFLDNAVLVAGMDDNYGRSHADPTVSQVAKFYVNGDNGYAQVKCFQNRVATNPGATNVSVYTNTNASVVATAYNEGAGWINYTAHGNIGEWSLPHFGVRDVHQMSNTGRFGVMIGNCCLSNKFDESECFGESLLRQGNYTGAVNYIGGSNYTYWSEDVYWSMGVRSNIGYNMSLEYDANHLGMYDKLFHLNGESMDKWIKCVGGIPIAGNMSVEQSLSSLNNYYWEVYHVMGDPSITPWMTQAEDMYMFPLDFVTTESNSVDFIVAPYSYVAMTKDSVLVASGFANGNGLVTLNFDNLEPEEYEVVASAMGYKTKFYAMHVQNLGINNATNMHVSVYPNPVSSRLTVEAEGMQDVCVVDVVGRVVMSKVVDADRAEIDIQSLSNGVYFVKVKAMDKMAIKKIVKK